MQSVRGTRDLLPQDNILFRIVESSAWKLAKQYGYGEIKTPIFEFSEIFHRTLGETSDMVSKETYTFQDRGGDSLTLRPEGTAGVARAFISEGLAQHLPLKLYYCGPMFRYERPQKGRYRQFYQLGVESLGFESPLADVECLNLAQDFLLDLGIKDKFQLEINTLGDKESRAKYRDLLVTYFSKYKSELSPDSQIRLEKNPLRILDSKDENDRKLIGSAPVFENELNEASKKFFDRVLNQLQRLNIQYQINPKLVRGIDYYCHTVFEFTTSLLGAQGTLLAGGRYDGLIESMGGPKTPGIGWAAGVERLMELIAPPQTEAPTLALLWADEAGEQEILKWAQCFRAQNISAEVIYTGNMGKKMKKAAQLGVHFVGILGSQEVQNQTLTLKNMKTGEQKPVSIESAINEIKGY